MCSTAFYKKEKKLLSLLSHLLYIFYFKEAVKLNESKQLSIYSFKGKIRKMLQYICRPYQTCIVIYNHENRYLFRYLKINSCT